MLIGECKENVELREAFVGFITRSVLGSEN